MDIVSFHLYSFNKYRFLDWESFSSRILSLSFQSCWKVWRIFYTHSFLYMWPHDLFTYFSLDMLGFVLYLCCYEFHRMVLDILNFMGPCHDEHFFLIRLRSRNHYFLVLKKKGTISLIISTISFIIFCSNFYFGGILKLLKWSSNFLVLFAYIFIFLTFCSFFWNICSSILLNFYWIFNMFHICFNFQKLILILWIILT